MYFYLNHGVLALSKQVALLCATHCDGPPLHSRHRHQASSSECWPLSMFLCWCGFPRAARIIRARDGSRRSCRCADGCPCRETRVSRGAPGPVPSLDRRRGDSTAHNLGDRSEDLTGTGPLCQSQVVALADAVPSPCFPLHKRPLSLSYYSSYQLPRFRHSFFPSNPTTFISTLSMPAFKSLGVTACSILLGEPFI